MHTPRLLAVLLLMMLCVPGILSAQIYIHGGLSGVLEDTVYFVDGGIIVGDLLIIEAGARFYFLQPCFFDVMSSGCIQALGTEQDSIKFLLAPGVTDWEGIYLLGSSDSTRFEYCYISGASAHALNCDECSPTISHCVITGNSGYSAIECYHSNAIISHTTISNNDCIAISSYSSSLTVSYCNILNNIDLGGVGGISCGARTTISHCIISGNTGESAGGISCAGDTISIEHCVIQNNTSIADGGGISCGAGNQVITNCDIIGNSANYLGGGIYCAAGAHPEITECSISDNWVNMWGGGIYCVGSTPEISRCVIRENSAQWSGGGICCNDSASPNIDHTIIWGNSSNGNGGGITSLFSYPAITNCTLSLNLTYEGGGAIYADSYSSLAVVNTIVHSSWGNGGIYIASPTDVSISYSDFYDNQGGNFAGQLPSGLGEPSTINYNGDSCDVFFNIELDPRLENPNMGEFHLQAGSPCIDAGDPQSLLDPDSTIADIGAFYFDQLGGVDPIGEIIAPSAFELMPNYPNPFNARTCLRYYIPLQSLVDVAVYNILGQRIETLFHDVRGRGEYTLILDATNLTSGAYFATLTAGSYTQTVKMILLK